MQSSECYRYAQRCFLVLEKCILKAMKCLSTDTELWKSPLALMDAVMESVMA